MRRLRIRESVTINVDGEDHGIDCYVKSVDGPVAGLGLIREIDSELRRLLTPGAAAYLTFSHNGVPLALRGMATAECGEYFDLAFLGLEAASLSERRRDVRVELATPATVHAFDGEGSPQSAPVETVTADLSMGGVLVELRAPVETGARRRVDLHFDVFPSPVRCDAVVVRQTGTHVGLRFTEMPESDRVRLAGVLAVHRQRADDAHAA